MTSKTETAIIAYATYTEKSTRNYSSAVTRAALALQIKAALYTAKASPFWNDQMRDGTQAMADFLVGQFDLKEFMP